MSAPALEDVVWLTSDRARPFLERATNHQDSLSSLAKSLRKDLNPQRTHLILEQAELRGRARVKFQHAERMFFTRQTLQQATGEDIARYVASRFPDGRSLADLCCGIGGNLIALAAHGPAVGVEKDPVVAHFASCNASAAGQGSAQVHVADASTYPIERHAAFFIDPDRRAHGRRTVDIKYYQPDLTTLERLISVCPNAAVKLAPATAVPVRWKACAEVEWIGYAGECKQQIAWFGELARHNGRRVATVCSRGNSEARSIVEKPNAEPGTTDQIEKFIYITHTAVVTARLVNSIAEEHSLARVDGSRDLLTGDDLVLDQALTSFKAVDQCSFNPRAINSALEKHDIAPNVVRTTGGRLPKMPQKLARSGGKMGGLFVTGKGSARQVTVAARCDEPG